jgi:phage shock protein E
MRTTLTFLVLTCLITGCSDQQPTTETVSVETETPQAMPDAASESVEESAEASTTEEPAEASEESKLLVIDVRTQAEWDEGHLDIATHIPLDQITDRITEVAPDKAQKIYLHCRSGGRSGQAKTQLEGLGYTNVENAGGLEDARAKFESGNN